MTVAIEARALTKTYRANGTEVEALRGTDLEVATGEFVAILGPSGCGKSTLLNVLGGLARPSGGSVALGGKHLAQLSDRDLADVRRRDVGFVFQLFNLVPVLSTEDNVGLPAVIAGEPIADRRTRVASLLNSVGLADKGDRLPSQLSGGEQQRVAIARALVMEPSVLLADEPTGNLDSRTGSDVMALFNRFHASGQTIVLVTHDPVVASTAERVLFMRDGTLVRETRLDRSGEAAALLTRLVELDT